MENPQPLVYRGGVVPDSLSLESLKTLRVKKLLTESVTVEEVFDYLRHLHDPEHPELSLEQLRVVKIEDISISGFNVKVMFTPTIPTCSVATIIGLTLLAKLKFCIPEEYKIKVLIAPGTHEQEISVNKQLDDKERVAAALENPNLMRMIKRGVKRADKLPSALSIF